MQILIEFYVSKQWEPDLTMQSAASGLGFHCLPMSHKKDASLKWVNMFQFWLKSIEAWSISRFYRPSYFMTVGKFDIRPVKG